MTKAKKNSRKGRPRSTEPTVSLTVRVRELYLKTLADIRKKGGKAYSSDGQVVEHVLLHAQTCEHFMPGELGLAPTSDGGAEKIDFSGL